jgi:hypothetical protein
MLLNVATKTSLRGLAESDDVLHALSRLL